MIRWLYGIVSERLAELEKLDGYAHAAALSVFSIPLLFDDARASGLSEEERKRIDAELKRYRNAEIERYRNFDPKAGLDSLSPLTPDKSKIHRPKEDEKIFAPCEIHLQNDSDAEDDISMPIVALMFFAFYLSLYIDYGIGHYLTTPPVNFFGGGVFESWAYVSIVSVSFMIASLLSLSYALRAPIASILHGLVILIAASQFIHVIEHSLHLRGAIELIWLFAVLIWIKFERHWNRRIILIAALIVGLLIFLHADGWQFLGTFDGPGRRDGWKIMLYFIFGSGVAIMLGYSMYGSSIASSKRVSPAISVAIAVNSAAFTIWGGLAALLFLFGKYIVQELLKAIVFKKSE